jgi:hypothetical protein
VTTTISDRRTPFWQIVAPLLLAFAAYAPILNNGFIADDFVVSQNAAIFKSNPLYLYQIPPENFRTTIYVAFSLLKAIAGYNAPVYYVFNIALHLTNVFLLGYLLRLLTKDPLLAFIGASFFAVVQAPQEAVMWLSGMTETLLAFFVLMTLILWARDHYFLATLTYVGALHSKESSILVLALVPLMQFYRGRRPFTWSYSLLLLPTAAFGVAMLATWHSNPMVSFGMHRVSVNAVVVLARSLHRLIWPWFYILIVLLWIARSWPGWKHLVISIGAVALLMTPYMFIAYSNALPSRNLYLASAGLTSVFAMLVAQMKKSRLAPLFVVAFIAFNIGYLWIRKDSQFEDRAAPTSAMLNLLKNESPERVLILGFPYENGEIARASVAVLPGWSHDSIIVGNSANDCPGCPQLQWDPQLKSYRTPTKTSRP